MLSGLERAWLPTIYVLDAKGVIRYKQIGGGTSKLEKRSKPWSRKPRRVTGAAGAFRRTGGVSRRCVPGNNPAAYAAGSPYQRQSASGFKFL